MRPVDADGRGRWVIVRGLCAALLASGCSGGPERGATPQVASELHVDAALIDAIRRERGLPREQALELAVEDALLADHLVELAPELGRWLERLVLARQTLAALAEEARAGGPPTDAEVQAITEARFWELDRPRMVAVAHAVVLAEAEDPAARAVAERIGKATAQAATEAEFVAAAKGVDAGSFTVRVEQLPPVAPDGRAVDPKRPPPAGPTVQEFARDFAAAAQRLTRPGEQSPVVRTPFGYHVLLARSILEPKQPSLDERRALLHDEIMSQRATALSAAVLERQRRESSPSQSRSALASMQRLAPERRGVQQ